METLFLWPQVLLVYGNFVSLAIGRDLILRRYCLKS